MNKEDLKQYKMHPQRAKELTGVEAELYVLTFDQLQELVNKNTDVIKSFCECEEPIPQMTDHGMYCLRCENPIKQTVL